MADLFQTAGARFGGVVTKHAAGWSNYDSEINHWNGGDMGPEKDLVGELGSAIHDRDSSGTRIGTDSLSPGPTRVSLAIRAG